MTRTEALLVSGLILPILDGLDEMVEGERGHAIAVITLPAARELRLRGDAR